MMMPMVLLATSTLALTPATRCTGRTSRLSRTSLASSTLAPPEAAEDVLPLDVGERKALSVTERLSRSCFLPRRRSFWPALRAGQRARPSPDPPRDLPGALLEA